jgi:hypothetical protein
MERVRSAEDRTRRAAIEDCGLRIADWPPKREILRWGTPSHVAPSSIRNPQSAIRNWHSALCHLSCVLLLLLACGCESDKENRPTAGSYYLSPYKDLRRIGRVALVELASTSDDPQIAATVTEALFLEAQKKQVFGVTAVHCSDPAWQELQENLDSLQTLRQLATAREALNSNGLLVGTLTKYRPYPHMVIGLRLKLLDLTDGQLLWGMEDVWDSSDRSIQQRIKAYLKEDRKTGHSPLREELVIVSPLSFCKFVAYEVAGTFERVREK